MNGTNLVELLRHAATRLREIEAGNPRLEAEYLLAHAMGLTRIELFRRLDQPAPPAARAKFARLLERRVSREPLQYVLGNVPFCELDLAVGPGVLIPRSETEVLVQHATEAARKIEARNRGVPDRPGNGDRGRSSPAAGGKVLAPLLCDVGTGSGSILLSLLNRLPGWRGVGTEFSSQALVWAHRNLEQSGLSARAMLLRADLLDPLPSDRFDLIVSNPPYIRSRDLPALAPEIREHEPPLALDGGDDGLATVRRLIGQAVPALVPSGALALELSPEQTEPMRENLLRSKAFAEAFVFPDLAGRPRVVLAWRR